MALKGQCSIIYNNTLYVYSPNALQSIPLQTNAQWSQEPMGVSVTGATCLYGGIDGDQTKPAMYIIGGAANSSMSQYPGLQRFALEDKTWKTITPLVTVTQNRKHHGTGFMSDTSTILVYGGDQNGDSNPSTQTFLLDTFPPYAAQSYQSDAPPVVDPTMLPWDTGHVGMVGGSTTNQAVWRFGVDEGWEYAGVTLPKPLPSNSISQSSLINLDDDSKILQTFDFSQSPNTVTSNVLLGPGGQPAPFGETVGGPSSSKSRKRKRQSTLGNFPTYNSTSAPTQTRNGASLVQGQDGTIVIVGGSTTNSLEVYNQTTNAWLDASQFFNPSGKQQNPIQSLSSSTSPTSSATSSSTASPTAAASSGHPSKSHTLTILGAVLGAVCGFAAILILLLLLLRYLKRSRQQRDQMRRDTRPPDKKGHARSSTEDTTLQPFSKEGQPMGRSQIPSAVDSVAMFGPKSEPKRTHARNASSVSNRLNPVNNTTHIGLVPGVFGGKQRDKSPLAISRPILQDPPAEIEQRADRNPSLPTTSHSGRSVSATGAPQIDLPITSDRKMGEGWSTYFSGSNVAGLPEPSRPFSSNGSRPGSSSSNKSRNSKRGSYWPTPEGVRASSKLGPMQVRDNEGNILAANSVAIGSPKFEHSASNSRSHEGLIVKEPMQGKISRASSVTDENVDKDAPDYDKIGDAYSSGIPASINEVPAWTPVGNTWSGPVQRQYRSRSSTASSIYNDPRTSATTHNTSILSGGVPSTGIPSFPMPGQNFRHVSRRSDGTNEQPAPIHYATTVRPQPSRPLRPSERDYFAGSNRFPHAPPPEPPSDPRSISNDVSWLNLGTPSDSNGHSSGNGNGGGR